MKVTFLVDNKTETIGCEAEWGLSMVVEANGKMILMDQGASDMLVRNAERLGMDLAKVDFATISHGHYDHSTGTTAFFGLNRTAPVYVHDQAFFYEIDSLGDRNIGIPWSEEFIRENDSRIIRTSGTYRIDEHTWLVGNVPSVEGFTPTDVFFMKVGDEFVPDTMEHEQTLVVEEGGVLHVFSGCSHKGIIPILRHIQSQIPGKQIATVVAGMHLYHASDELIDQIIAEMQEMGVKYVLPVHCTGMNAIMRFKMQMGDALRIAHSGYRFEAPLR